MFELSLNLGFKDLVLSNSSSLRLQFMSCAIVQGKILRITFNVTVSF
jgi:hypothetical protein